MKPTFIVLTAARSAGRLSPSSSRQDSIVSSWLCLGMILLSSSQSDILIPMKLRATFAVLCSLATLPLLAQRPLACVSKFVPPKPTGLYCLNAVPVCITDSSGLSGEWVWGCSASGSNVPVPSGGVVQSPPLQPHIDTPVETMLKVEQLRNLRLRNQQWQNQINGQQDQATPLPLLVAFSDSYAAVPMPTGHKKRDQKNWTLWLKQNILLTGLVSPKWSKQEYDRVHSLVVQQAATGH